MTPPPRVFIVVDRGGLRWEMRSPTYWVLRSGMKLVGMVRVCQGRWRATHRHPQWDGPLDEVARWLVAEVRRG